MPGGALATSNTPASKLAVCWLSGDELGEWAIDARATRDEVDRNFGRGPVGVTIEQSGGRVYVGKAGFTMANVDGGEADTFPATVHLVGIAELLEQP